ncbi:MAG: beta-1,4-mannosyl-glycoprotein beta-1,4-N-acetylglucosaminyltransferase [Pelagibacterales bacterium]|nr:beta-1,4-mannosyl-glycoprotein beta-1,4-N-acetylglucosaminyltransferase [Pelagibacterales bacterium]
MKIFDCTTFFDENLMLEVRLNILDKYVDKFVIAESKYSHSGKKKKLNFDLSKFSNFKKKIIYIVTENEPSNLIYKKEKNLLLEEKEEFRRNSIKRISKQRDSLLDGLSEAEPEDYIFYSDNDEIPNFEGFNLKENKSKILIFKQKLFYYKFNLFCDRVDWYGTKGCKKKDLISFAWLREIKSKKYNPFRLDTIFSKNKYINLKIIQNGGWHFSQLKTPKDIEIKLLNQEHHDEYRIAKENLPTVEELVKRKSIAYDHKAKSSDYKYSKEFKLKTLPINSMPLFLQNNMNKYNKWFDYDVS